MIVDDLIKRALRKIGALPSGEEVSPSEGQEALDGVISMYQEFIGTGALGGQMRDVYIPANSADYIAREGDRITAEDISTVTITLPTVATWPWYFPWWQNEGIYPYEPVTYPNANNKRPLLDGSVVIINDQASDAQQMHFYDSSTARWVDLLNIVLADEAPMSRRYGDGLACELAIRLAPEYGLEPASAVALGAARFRSTLASKPDGLNLPKRHGAYF